jgi:5-methylcytosine-specific restriction protein A
MPSAYPFAVNTQYTRRDVFEIVGINDPGGGSWYTGYTAHGDDWFIFCGIGTPGRTGHNYPNHFRDGALVWYGKNRSRLGQPSTRSLLRPRGRVYIFYREYERSPFTFAGVGTPQSWRDVTPVEIVWSLEDPNSAVVDTLPEEIPSDETVFEGAKKTVAVNIYERDPTARKACIRHWGATCVVCRFDFGATYGSLGEGFVHVHHLRPISEIGERYRLDPIRDLRPVCPNCHAMLHRKRTVLDIDQLKAMLRSSK